MSFSKVTENNDYVNPIPCVAIEPDWLVPIESPPIHRGYMVVEQGRVAFVGIELPAKFTSIPKVRLADTAILPGLVNSHCHLEFSDLIEPIPVGASFPSWIRSVIDRRKSIDVDSLRLAEARQASLSKGIVESYVAGVRWVVDMTTQPWSSGWIDSAVDNLSIATPSVLGGMPQPQIVVQPCFELIDISQSRCEQTLGFAKSQCAGAESNSRGRGGLAPHATYTASPRLTQRCVNTSKEEQRLVSMHLAESVEEMEWIRTHSGPFSELLSPILGEDYFKSLGSVEQHLKFLSQAWRALIVHGNYLSVRDLAILSQHAASMAVVHCPRTHGYFGHAHETSKRYPLAERMSAGVRHLLGTDSRASNPDLNLWSEAQAVRANHPGIASEQILRMVTTDAANFLTIGDRYGDLSVGRPANLTAIQCLTCPNVGSSHGLLYDAILSTKTRASPLESLLLA